MPRRFLPSSAWKEVNETLNRTVICKREIFFGKRKEEENEKEDDEMGDMVYGHSNVVNRNYPKALCGLCAIGRNYSCTRR
jgi:hypothetical protein